MCVEPIYTFSFALINIYMCIPENCMPGDICPVLLWNDYNTYTQYVKNRSGV